MPNLVLTQLLHINRNPLKSDFHMPHSTKPPLQLSPSLVGQRLLVAHAMFILPYFLPPGSPGASVSQVKDHITRPPRDPPHHQSARDVNV